MLLVMAICCCLQVTYLTDNAACHNMHTLLVWCIFNIVVFIHYWFGAFLTLLYAYIAVFSFVDLGTGLVISMSKVLVR